MGFPTTSLREALWVKTIFLRCHFSFVLMVPKQRWDKLLVPLRECWGSGPKLGQWSWRYSPPNRQRNNKKPNVQTKAMSISLTNVIDTALKVINFMETWVHLFLMLCMKMWEVLIHINHFCHPVAYAGFLEGTLLCDWVVSDARCLLFETLFFTRKPLTDTLVIHTWIPGGHFLLKMNEGSLWLLEKQPAAFIAKDKTWTCKWNYNFGKFVSTTICLIVSQGLRMYLARFVITLLNVGF